MMRCARAIGKTIIPAMLCLMVAFAQINPSANQIDPEMELYTGTALTRAGKLEEAIPHLLAARGHVKEEYAASFNLALCYFGTQRYQQSIHLLEELRAHGQNTATVNNLLAQAYAAVSQPEKAFAAFKQAADLKPTDEKMYAFMADACTDSKQYDLGLRIVDLGLKNLASSARLHYERAMFLAQLDRFEVAKPEFERAVALAPDSDIAALARTQELLFEDNIKEAIRTAREAISKGHHDYVLQDLLAEVLIHAGATPGQPEFAEARSLLESATAQKPDYSTAQIALGRLYLMENRPADAVTHLEIGRSLQPRNPAVYTSLANAYRRLGEEQKARQMLAELKIQLQTNSHPDANLQK